jgi:hypothetical protein
MLSPTPGNNRNDRPKRKAQMGKSNPIRSGSRETYSESGVCSGIAPQRLECGRSDIIGKVKI